MIFVFALLVVVAHGYQMVPLTEFANATQRKAGVMHHIYTYIFHLIKYIFFKTRSNYIVWFQFVWMAHRLATIIRVDREMEPIIGSFISMFALTY